MANPSPAEPAGDSTRPAGERLGSWKEIAVYLGRDVRTVQRWERLQGLPVHRHQHNRLSTAYAYKSELDGWWTQRPSGRTDETSSPEVKAGADDALPDTTSPSLRPTHSGSPSPRSRAWYARRPVLIVAIVLMAVTTALVIGMGRRDLGGPSAAPLPFVADDWVLVTAYQNHTGVPVFDDTLAYVLRQQLSSSSFLRVASPDRIRDALQLMRRPPETIVDVAVGREIGLRDGAIRVLLAGRIDLVGDRFDVSLDLVSPVDGRVVASDRRRVARQEEVLDAVGAQAEWARRTLGERSQDLVAPAPFERVTTSSLEALQLYSRAMDLGMQHNWAAAAKLLNAAIQQDPEFASAHILLAHALSNTGRPPSEVLPHAARAHELAQGVDEVERHFIEGSYLTFDANTRQGATQFARLQEAAATYEALVQLSPRHYWGTNNLMFVYQRLGQQDAAAALAVQRGIERPNDLRSQLAAAVALVAWTGTPEAAIPAATRATELLAAGIALDPASRSWLDLFPAHLAWAQGDVDRARRLVDQASKTLAAGTGDQREDYAMRVGGMYLTLGRCRDAAATFESLKLERRHEALAIAAMHCDDIEAFTARMLADVPYDVEPSYARAMWGPRTGRLADAERWISDFRRRFTNRVTLAVADGELAAERGDWARARDRLEEAWTYLRLSGQERACTVAERLADVYFELRRPERAFQILESTVALRPQMYAFEGLPGGMPWIRAQAALAARYRAAGRADEAAKREAAILPLLSQADPDLPLLARLQGR